MIPIELTVEEQGGWHYRACWCDGEHPYMVARRLLE